jgi:hypothetical protein
MLQNFMRFGDFISQCTITFLIIYHSTIYTTNYIEINDKRGLHDEQKEKKEEIRFKPH